MGSVHARGDTFLTFGLKALTETNTSRLATATNTTYKIVVYANIFHIKTFARHYTLNSAQHLSTGLEVY
jgi:hypothetical protein